MRKTSNKCDGRGLLVEVARYDNRLPPNLRKDKLITKLLVLCTQSLGGYTFSTHVLYSIQYHIIVLMQFFITSCTLNMMEARKINIHYSTIDQKILNLKLIIKNIHVV